MDCQEAYCFVSKTDGQTGNTCSGGPQEKGGAWRMGERLGRSEREEQQVLPLKKDHSGNPQRVTGMLLVVFEQGGCIIKTLSWKVNLALLCGWFERRD